MTQLAPRSGSMSKSNQGVGMSDFQECSESTKWELMEDVWHCLWPGHVGEDPLETKVPKSTVHNQDERILCMQSEVRFSHKIVNNQFKQFECLATAFRHHVAMHAQCFRACAVLTQLSIEHGILFLM